jgi:ribosomal protein S12 methylthiotransferase
LQEKKVGIASLGCAKNQVDSERLLADLVQEGYEIVASPHEADILVVNTCGFIEAAKEESIDTILEFATYKNKGQLKKLIVVGCLAQRYPTELRDEIPEIDAVVGTGELGRLAEILRTVDEGERIVAVGTPGGSGAGPRIPLTGSGTAFLKIAEGCNNHCSYCVIPMLRGPLVSRPEEELVEEARFLARKGAREIAVVAQDTTSYGLDLYKELRLASLLRKLAAVKEVEWLRVLYLYPERITEELLTVMAQEEKICHYLDIPVQHASDKILRAMGRASRRAGLEKLFDQIRKVLPDAALRTTFIVGFPGESDEDFDELIRFIREQEFDWVGAFPYSLEEGTPAAQLPYQVCREVKNDRLDRLLRIQRSISLKRNRAWLGKTLTVLVERAGEKRAVGRCFRQAPEVDGVTHIRAGGLVPGVFVPIKIERVGIYDMVGRVVHEPAQ